MISDEELAIQLQSGSDEALEQILNRYHEPIYIFVLRMTRDYHATLDIVQEVFIKMCKGIKYYRAGFSFRAWLYSIANNTYKDYRKNAYTRKVVLGLEGKECFLVTDNTPEDEFFKDDERTRLIKAIHDLGDIYSETLILRYYQDLRLDEIALVLNIPTGTVKSRLSNGLSQLRQSLCSREY